MSPQVMRPPHCRRGPLTLRVSALRAPSDFDERYYFSGLLVLLSHLSVDSAIEA
jgi:hypothetical protein